MIYHVYYDGFDIAQHCVINSINKPLAAGTTGMYLESNNTYRLMKEERHQIILEIEVTILEDALKGIDELNKILYSEEHKPLIISDQPDRYLMCKLEGEIRPSSRDYLSTFILTFISPDNFWRSTLGPQTFIFDSQGRVLVTNYGTAPSPPVIDIQFPSDNGYLALVSPSRYITLGNALERNSVDVPPSEMALSHSLKNITGWTRTTNASALIPDYIKMTSDGTAKTSTRGIELNPSTLGTTEVWHGHAYQRTFEMGVQDLPADNFNLTIDANIHDLTGKRNHTMAMLVVVLDESNNPIMTTSIYDGSQDKNELTITFKVPDPKKPKHSKIIYSDKLPALNGSISMSKMGSKFDWQVYNRASQTTKTSVRDLKVGDVVKLKPTVRYIYDWSGNRLTLDTRIIGQELSVFQIRNTPRGKYGLKNVRYGYVEGFFEAEDIAETGSTENIYVPDKTVKHTYSDNNVAQLRASKVLIWQAKWGKTDPYDVFALSNINVKRIYTSDTLEIVNTFMKGDTLTIDNKEGVILHNGIPYTGFQDYDSRFFKLNGGTSELAIQVSDWATMPTAQVILESRWL